MSNAPIKTLFLKGNLKDGIKIKLYPFSEFQQGRWNFSISQLIFNLKNEVNINGKVQSVKEICGLLCNFIKGTQYSVKNEIETIYQNLYMFILQGLKSEKKLINFEKKWSLINNLSEELKIYVTNLADSAIFEEIESDFYVLVLLQRIE
jgi:hypothetical protein